MERDQSINVLIVEDQPITRAGLRYTLETIPNLCIVGEVEDGAAAITTVLDKRPDVTLMDIGIPQIDGVAATAHIKEKWPDARIIILTTHENREYIFTSLAAGANGYCLKSATARELELAIKSVMTGTVWLDPGIAKQVLEHSVSGSMEQSSKPPKESGKFALTERETQVLQLLVDGLSNQQMAERLFLGQETIKTHMRHIMEKLVVADRTQAAVKALRQGLIS